MDDTRSPENAAQVEQPERIWLEPKEGSDPDQGRLWCEDQAWDDGTEYIRADLAAPPAPDQTALIAKLRTALQYCVDTWSGLGGPAEDWLHEARTVLIDSQAKTNGEEKCR